MSDPTSSAAERAGMRTLRDHFVLDRGPEAEFDTLARIAARVFEAPVALISIVEGDRHWIKAREGLPAGDDARDAVFCAQVVAREAPFMVRDAARDPRFSKATLVVDEGIRFYAGMPLRTSDGSVLGALSVMDRQTREPGPEPMALLEALAKQVVDQLELRRQTRLLEDERAFLADLLAERETMRQRVSQHDRLVTIGSLASSVGHEINNPLTYITANLDFAVDELSKQASKDALPRAGEVAEALTEARDGAERIRKIVRGLRAFGRDADAQKPTDVKSLLDIAAHTTMHAIRRRASLRMELDAVPPVAGDEAKLSQVFVHLLMNAAQAFATPEPDKNAITLRAFLGNDGRVAIEVDDNGSGIAPDDLARVFDPFFTTRPAGQALGLGLPICRGIVTSLSGHIAIDSRAGRGTRVRVSLPAARGETARVRSIRPTDGGRSGRVFIIDDEEAVARGIERLLRDDFAVTICSDPEEALRRLANTPDDFDVILCDVMMPEVSGPELFARAVGANAAIADRFVFMTGVEIHESVRTFLSEMPNVHLPKPFRPQELRETIERVLAEQAYRHSYLPPKS